MNIIQAHKFYWHRDGASNYMLYLSSLLEDCGHHVIPFATFQGESLKTEYDKYFVEYIDLSNPKKLSILKKIKASINLFYSKEASNNMERLLKYEKQKGNPVDILHIHNIYNHISPSILGVAKKYGVKIVMTLHDYKLLSPNYSLYYNSMIHEEDAHGWYFSCIRNKCIKSSYFQSTVSTAEMIFHHKLKKYYEKYVDTFISPSLFMIDLCERNGWDRSRFVHVPHPIDTNVFRPKGNKNTFEVIYIGRLSEEKGLDVLLDSAKQTPGIPYRIIGTGPEDLRLKKRTEHESITNVVFSGFQHTDQIKESLQNARIIVLPSQWYENYPISILEAKATGSIVIGSRVGGIPELLETDMLFSPPQDSSALARLISYWYEVPSQEREKRGRLLRQEVQEKNDPKIHVKKIEQTYLSVK